MKKILASLLVLVAGGVVLANREAPLSMTPMSARVVLPAPTITPLGTCQGADGTYTLLHVTGSGPITSADPRLSGTFTADALILDNPNTGMGVSTDNFEVTDPATGAVKMRGTAWAIDENPYPIKALAMAELADGSRYITFTTVTLPAGPTDPLVIEYGGAGFPSSDRALVVEGECGKMFKHFGFR
jgi:hypothetical protein